MYANSPLKFGTVSMVSKIVRLLMSYTYVLSCKRTTSLHFPRQSISVFSTEEKKVLFFNEEIILMRILYTDYSFK